MDLMQISLKTPRLLWLWSLYEPTFATGIMEKQVNATISLQYQRKRMPHPCETMTHCSCTTIYKCIAKLLANWMKEVLPHCISTNEAAFVNGRSAFDNILLAHELVHNYQRVSISPWSVIKIDLLKALVLLIGTLSSTCSWLLVSLRGM